MTINLHQLKALSVSASSKIEYRKPGFSFMGKFFLLNILLILTLSSIGRNNRDKNAEELSSVVQIKQISNQESNNVTVAGDSLSTLDQNKDVDLILNNITENSKRILRVSFNGNEGSEGSLKMISLSNKVLKEANFELIKYPYYASVDITDLPAATYKVELATKKGIHTSFLIVK